MPILLRRPPRRRLTASAALATTHDPTAAQRHRGERSWQERAWEYFDALGEIKYPSRFYSRSLSKLELRVEQADGAGGWAETQDPKANGVLDRITQGNVPKMLGAYGQLMFVVGECYLVCFFGALGVETWEILSMTELELKDGKYTRRVSPADTGTDYPEADPTAPKEGEAIAYRMWREHPRYSDEADSSVRGVLDLCEELLLLQQAIRAQAKNRAAGNGILLWPEEMDEAAADVRDAPDNPESIPFTKRLTEHLVAPIGNEGSSASVVPLLVTAAADLLDKPRFLTLTAAELYKEIALRQEAIDRIAIGLDLPPEILQGTGDSNHWSAWAIDEDSFKNHVQPLADSMAADITDAFFRPTLKMLGVENIDEFRIYYDYSKVVTHPNRGADAKDLRGAGIISAAALRTATGFDESDKMTPAEYREWVGLTCRDPSMATGGPITSVAHAPNGGSPPGASIPNQPGQDPGAVNGGPPVQASVDRIYGAAELCIDRARELAGARLRSQVKDPALAARIKGVPNRQVGLTLGRGVGVDPDSLVAGAGDTFMARLQTWGIAPPITATLVRECEEHAAATLYEDTPPLNDTIIGLCQLAGLKVEAQVV